MLAALLARLHLVCMLLAAPAPCIHRCPVLLLCACSLRSLL